ncbi:uncharacterized protein TrAtP1_002441 [Trichoderma atroviride]|uniref:uncharacterized protein n=1 Tax=Hypocrea atroviridis TaxID=63577 RepID=UPI003332941E|nr:hypothetical protein TrAtP1_002441 [Trichoderma atroviride]
MESEQISVTVLLPDMFQTFLKQEALVNPHYEKVKMESEEWLSECFLMMTEAPTGVQRRFALAMQGYCQGALIQIDSASKTPSLEEVVLIRQRSAGCKPLYHLVEYAHGLLIPDEVFDNPVIRELECLGMDMVAISNDILSYRKEQEEGVPHNMVTVCRSNGMPLQKAFNTVGKLLEQRYWRWDEAEAKVPSWGEETDVQVRKYIEGIKCIVKANLNWSFKSERYLGSNPAQVRVTRVLRISAETPVSQDRMVAVKKHHSTLQYNTLNIVRSLIIWLFHLIQSLLSLSLHRE